MFTDKQREYLKNATHLWNVKCGATRSGKTYLDLFVIPKRIKRVRGKSGLVVFLGNTKGTLKRNVIEPLREVWGKKYVSDIKSDGTAELFGERVHCLGADKLNQVDRLRGTSIKYCYGDEVVTWHPDVFNMLKTRLDKEYSRFDGTCNPDNPGHWFKKFLDSDVDLYLQNYCLDDNSFLPETVKENIKRNVRGTVYYDRYILGKWVAAEGLVYPTFANCKEEFVVDSIDPDDIIFATIGIDFGGNGSAHAFVLNGFAKGMREVVAIDEWYLKKEISPAELESAYVAFAKKCLQKYKIAGVYCDSAETTLINGIRNATIAAGLPLCVYKAKKGAINDRIAFFNRLMSYRRFKITKDCPHLAEGFENAVWDEKSLRDKRLDNGSVNIDSLDACEYATESYMNMIIFGEGV